jgi:hypothetical protein
MTPNHKLNKANASVAVNERRSGFFIKGFESSTSYEPIWGHLQVSEEEGGTARGMNKGAMTI